LLLVFDVRSLPIDNHLFRLSVPWGNVDVDAVSPAHVDCRYPCAPVAQLDRAVASGATGREFESLRAHQIPPSISEQPLASRTATDSTAS
jgi:hypothetical protein